MEIQQVTQGSDQWIKLRETLYCASDAPVIMGASPHTSRDDYLKMKTTGSEKEFSRYVQERILDKGHELEALQRLLIEQEIGEELYPVVCTEGTFLASLDGLTLSQKLIFEHKSWNEKLAQRVRDEDLDPQDYWQLEHQLMVTGAEEVLFVVSDGTAEKRESMLYRAIEEREKDLIAGWAMVVLDLKDYEPIAEVVKPSGTELMQLPALNIELVGEVKNSNLVVYENTAMAFIQAINTDLQTDQDFADAENVVKFCEKAEEEIELSKKMALSQTSTIDDLFRTMDRIKEELRQKRLTLGKLVKSRKEEVKWEITSEAQAAIGVHVAELAPAHSAMILQKIVPDFKVVIKGKRTVKSIREACNDEIARCKIAANEIVETIRANEKVVSELSETHQMLFSDMATLVFNDKGVFAETARRRVEDHDREENEKKAAAELERTTKIKDRISKIQSAATEAITATVDGSKAILVKLENIDLDQGFDEYAEDAKATIAVAMDQVKVLVGQKEESARLLQKEIERQAEAEPIVEIPTPDLAPPVNQVSMDQAAEISTGKRKEIIESWAISISNVIVTVPDIPELKDAVEYLRLAKDVCDIAMK